MRMNRRGLLLAFAGMALLSGCAGVSSSGGIAPPQLVDYPAEFQVRAAEELEALGPGCPLHAPGSGCSTVATMIEDYGELRARVARP
ncbi:MAG TPA: hypothetical protein VK035_01975 [Kiloniellales bacterium]|nr:hypothetical protein [Kiloniellales bacterium]